MLAQLAGYYSRHGPRWEDAMLASYRTLNPEQAVWFDANPTTEAELLARLQPGGYLYTTFGPGGQNKTVCDFVFLLLTVGDIVSRSNVKAGDLLRWDIDGTVTVQNDLPNHTLGAGAGILTCSSTDGWTGVSRLFVNSNNFSGVLPLWAMPSMQWFRVDKNAFSGDLPAYDFPVADFFYANENNFSSVDAPLSGLPNVSAIRLYTNGLSQSAVDAALLAIYNNRLNYTAAAPSLQIHVNSAPSGTYQANCPTAQTGKEYQYHLVNDPCADGHNPWTITANT